MFRFDFSLHLTAPPTTTAVPTLGSLSPLYLAMSATEAVLAPGALPPPPEKKAGLATADADTSGGTAPGSAAAVSTDATDSMGKTGKVRRLVDADYYISRLLFSPQ